MQTSIYTPLCVCMFVLVGCGGNATTSDEPADLEMTAVDVSGCFRCLGDAPWFTACEDSPDAPEDIESCSVGDLQMMCNTPEQCCGFVGRTTDADGTCGTRQGGTIEFITLEGGDFQMGDDGRWDGQPIQNVSVPGFQISRAEITIGQYRACVQFGGCAVPGDRSWTETPGWTDEPGINEHHPIAFLSWEEAKTFADFAGARLPTEAEWEFAAKSGGQDITFPWGDEPPTCDRLNFDNCIGETQPVCSYYRGRTDQGLCDMIGNLAEWVEDDWHESLDGAPNDGSAWVDLPRREYRVARGGSFAGDQDFNRAAYRGFVAPIPPMNEPPYRNIGFRIARDLEGTTE